MKIFPVKLNIKNKINSNYAAELRFLDLRRQVRLSAINDFEKDIFRKRQKAEGVQDWVAAQKAMLYQKYYGPKSGIQRFFEYVKSIFS